MKKILITISAIALIFSLSACNNNSKKNYKSEEACKEQVINKAGEECEKECTGGVEGRCCQDSTKPKCTGEGHGDHQCKDKANKGNCTCNPCTCEEGKCTCEPCTCEKDNCKGEAKCTCNPCTCEKGKCTCEPCTCEKKECKS